MYVHTPHLTSPQAEAALSSATTTSAGGTAATTGSTGSTSGGHQPVEFNHAINYVNKIKVHCSFCRQTSISLFERSVTTLPINLKGKGVFMWRHKK